MEEQKNLENITKEQPKLFHVDLQEARKRAGPSATDEYVAYVIDENIRLREAEQLRTVIINSSLNIVKYGSLLYGASKILELQDNPEIDKAIYAGIGFVTLALLKNLYNRRNTR